MNDEKIIQIIQRHFEGLFPKNCPNCDTTFATLGEYILATERFGGTISYDAEIGDWDTTNPMGGVALAKCSCGNSLALTTKGIPLPEIQLVLQWIKNETEERGVSPMELLGYLRDEVRKRALGDIIHNT